MRDPLFTPRFFIMCAYSFTVFVSVFQLLPTAPYRIIELGGTTAAAGLFLGLPDVLVRASRRPSLERSAIGSVSGAC